MSQYQKENNGYSKELPPVQVIGRIGNQSLPPLTPEQASLPVPRQLVQETYNPWDSHYVNEAIKHSANQLLEGGVKYDSGKPDWTLLDKSAIDEIAKVLDYGARKYPSKDNWKRVDNAKQRYLAAAYRHLAAYNDGEKNDAESGLSHLAHLGACVMFLLHFEVKNNAKEDNLP